MVEAVSWFAKVDYPILDFLSNHDIEVSPSVVAWNIGYDNDYVGKRLRALSGAGLLNRVDEGRYEVSDLGRQFLAGDLDAEDVEDLNPGE
jgi:predicted transcriptional regulator